MAEHVRVSEFALPDLGEGLTEAEIVRWLVGVGEVIVVDQPIVAVETAKALVEVECPYGGVVTARFGEEGEEIPVGTVLVTVADGASAPGALTPGAPGVGAATSGPSTSGPSTTGATELGATDVGGADGGRPAPPAGSPGPDQAADRDTGQLVAVEQGPAVGTGGNSDSGAASGSGQVLVGYGTQSTAGRRRGRVRLPPGLNPPGELTEPAVGQPSAHHGPLTVISPLVRRQAREHQVDLRTVAGSGPDGLILRADVQRAVEAAAGVPTAPRGGPEPAEGLATGGVAQGSRSRAEDGVSPAAYPTVSPSSAPLGRRIPLRGVRGSVADKLSRSRREIPEATCWVDADATELLAARGAMSRHGERAAASSPWPVAPDQGRSGEPSLPSAARQPKVPLLALLARICTAALARYPELNATVDLDAREIVQFADVQLGFAAQTSRGLMVPVIRDAGALTLDQLSAAMVRLTDAARAGTLSPAQLTGGTFTLNNYGVFGVDGSTPIINYPEAAMLGVGRIVPKPWVHQGELAVRQVVQLSLTFDHRVCDGGTAGGFLRYVADCVEQPVLLLRGL